MRSAFRLFVASILLTVAAGFARAQIVSPQLLEELFVPVHYAMTALDSGFGRESLPALTRGLETRTGRGVWLWYAWHTSI